VEHHAGSGSKKVDTTTKEVSCLSTTEPDMEWHATESLSPSQDRIDAISGELRDIKRAPSLGVGLPSFCSLKIIAIQLQEIKEINELSHHSQEQLKHSLEHSWHSQEQLKHSLEQSQHSLRHSQELQEMQSLELQEMKASLLSLERTVKKLSEKSEVGLPNDDVITLLSSFSSNPPPTKSITPSSVWFSTTII